MELQRINVLKPSDKNYMGHCMDWVQLNKPWMSPNVECVPERLMFLSSFLLGLSQASCPRNIFNRYMAGD